MKSYKINKIQNRSQNNSHSCVPSRVKLTKKVQRRLVMSSSSILFGGEKACERLIKAAAQKERGRGNNSNQQVAD